jgi:hypothetical protein
MQHPPRAGVAGRRLRSTGERVSPAGRVSLAGRSGQRRRRSLLSPVALPRSAGVPESPRQASAGVPSFPEPGQATAGGARR